MGWKKCLRNSPQALRKSSHSPTTARGLGDSPLEFWRRFPGALAWTVAYRSSGMMTFIVNESGTMYEKDLGPNPQSLQQR
jgi:hypothetical protein